VMIFKSYYLYITDGFMTEYEEIMEKDKFYKYRVILKHRKNNEIELILYFKKEDVTPTKYLSDFLYKNDFWKNYLEENNIDPSNWYVAVVEELQ